MGLENRENLEKREKLEKVRDWTREDYILIIKNEWNNVMGQDFFVILQKDFHAGEWRLKSAIRKVRNLRHIKKSVY